MARSLWPREHGAYGELGVPMASALALASGSPAAWCLAASFALAFLAWEPLLVASGRRGAKPRRVHGRRARRRCIGLAGIAIGLGLVAIGLSGPSGRWALAVPVPPVLAMAWLLGQGRVTGRAPEMVGAVALSSLSVPVAALGGVDGLRVVVLGVVWVLGFASLTLAVQITLERARGDRRRRWLGVASALVVGGAWLAATLTTAGGWLVPAAPIALAPMSAAPLGTLALRPRPQRLKGLGWTAIVASLASGGLLLLSL